MAYSVQVVLRDVSGSVQVGIERERTMFTDKDRLEFAVAPFGVTATTALLAGISGGSVFNRYSFGFGLVSQELLKLVEVPFVQVFSLRFSRFCVSDALEVFKDYCASSLNQRYNLFGDCVVDIPTKPLFLGFKSSKVPFARMSFRLKGTSKFLVPTRNRFDFLSIKKLVGGQHRNLVDSTVNPDELAVGRDVRDILLENDVQKDLVLPNEQIRRSIFPSKILFKVSRDNQRKFLTSIYGRNGDNLLIEPKRVGVHIQTDGRSLGLWARSLLTSLNLGVDRVKRLCGLGSGRDGQLGWKPLATLLVGLVVKRISVVVVRLKTRLTDKIERLGVSIDGRLKLLWRAVNNQFCCLNQLHTLNSFYNYLHFTYTKNTISENIFCKLNKKGERLFLPDTKDVGVS